MNPPMSHVRLAGLTALALVAFAGNSLLCRLALRSGGIDAASFTSLRLLSGAAMLWLLLALRGRRGRDPTRARGDWTSALALFTYAAAFSFAYLGLSAATGALLLFGAVQLAMLGRGFALGERLRALQWLGLLLALGGLVWLLLPGLEAPPLFNAVLMLGAGVAWGLYSLRGRGAVDPLAVTTGNFLRTVPLTLGMSALAWRAALVDWPGALAALASGALASGLGYALWYAALPSLRASTAGILQLAVPVLAALGGIVLLGEPIGWRFATAAALTLGGIALATLRAR